MTSDLHHLAAAYALDALDAEERRSFEAHYPTCEICSQEVADFREVAGSLAASTSTAAPVDLKARVMAEVAQTRQLSPRVPLSAGRSRWRSSAALLAAAAALVVLAGFAALSLRQSTDERISEVVGSADVVMTTLDATTDAPGRLQIVWSATRDEVVVIGNQLNDVSSESAYALWFILEDGSVAPAALFQPEDGEFKDVIDVDDLDPVGWGISVEPEAGSPQPTTEVIFAGTL